MRSDAQPRTADEKRAQFRGLPVADLALASAIFLPGGGRFARCAERLASRRWLLGAFVVASGRMAERGGDGRSVP